jgi:hypothetical protein
MARCISLEEQLSFDTLSLVVPGSARPGDAAGTLAAHSEQVHALQAAARMVLMLTQAADAAGPLVVDPVATIGKELMAVLAAVCAPSGNHRPADQLLTCTCSGRRGFGVAYYFCVGLESGQLAFVRRMVCKMQQACTHACRPRRGARTRR